MINKVLIMVFSFELIKFFVDDEVDVNLRYLSGDMLCIMLL